MTWTSIGRATCRAISNFERKFDVVATLVLDTRFEIREGRQGMAWQVQDAKQKFSQLIHAADTEGPQIVTRHGEEVAVVLSMKAYRRLAGKRRDFVDCIMSSPPFDDLELERSREPTRPVEL